MHPAPPNRPADELIIEGARQNNLKNISLRIPHNKVTAITGLSGSGRRPGLTPVRRRTVALCRVPLDLCAHVSRQGTAPTSTACSTFARRLPSSKRIPSAPLAPPSAPPLNSPILAALFAKIGKTRVCPDCRQKLAVIIPAPWRRSCFAQFSTRGPWCCSPSKTWARHDRSLMDALMKRGFTRLRCGDEIVDLHDQTSS